MKTMKDFKGTPGEFEIMGNKIQVDPDHPMNTITVAMMYGSMALEENHANARLFVNSKRVLEAAIKYIESVQQFARVAGNSHFTVVANCRADMYEKERNLEQAINDSL